MKPRHRRPLRRSLCAAALASFATLAGCETVPPAQLVQPPTASESDRQLQTRRFDGISEERLLAACIGVLQDLGFNIKGSHPDLGVAYGMKEREAKAPEQVAAYTLLVLLLAAAGGNVGGVPAPTQEQTISVLVTTRPVAGSEGRSHETRVTFHRFLREPLVQEAGALREAKLYEAFFELLSKALFLEAHRL